jgi:arginyl-tRNA synthetase
VFWYNFPCQSVNFAIQLSNMSIEITIQSSTVAAIKNLFDAVVEVNEITLNETRKEFAGDFTVVIFPLLRYTKKNPEESAQLIGQYLKTHLSEIADFNVVKGFLNLSLSAEFWQSQMQFIYEHANYGHRTSGGDKVMVEYSSPNTNKPLHLGHLRNNVLGFALSGILKANGHEVVMVNLINDRGIHICKSMVAWQKYGNGETPESSGLKGDHLVGKYYVAFDKQYKIEMKAYLETHAGDFGFEAQQISTLKKELEQKEKDKALSETEKENLIQLKKLFQAAEKNAPIMLAAQEMLRQWEANQPEVKALWSKMNQWVYDGFAITYQNLGVTFDQYYYESDTYLLGKAVVEKGLADGVFFKKADGSVWIDLSAEGLDEKILLRSDGTSVYITQDIGTADKKFADYGMQRSIYVVGNEQDYHFKVLQKICQKLGRSYADGLLHFSYGMVDLPSGKMKSREGTVVDADDLMSEMMETVKIRTQELGKIEGFTPEEATKLFHTIALGGLKFYLLKVEPRKGMLFNPEESIDFQGYTGTFTQFNYARIRSIIRRYELTQSLPAEFPKVSWNNLEVDLIKTIHRYPKVIEEAGTHLNPAALVDYAYNLAKSYSKYYAEVSILGAQEEDLKTFRVMLSSVVARTIKDAFAIVGIEVPERM